MPTLLCHRLVVDGDRIVGYRLRMPDQKRAAVEAFRSPRTTGWSPAGDSYNDAAMLDAADAGFWFHAPAVDRRAAPRFPACDDYPSCSTRSPPHWPGESADLDGGAVGQAVGLGERRRRRRRLRPLNTLNATAPPTMMIST